MTDTQYKKTWGTPIGQDCISLDTSLCGWLGARLLFLSEHASSSPYYYGGTDNHEVSCDLFTSDLRDHGNALMRWAKHFDAAYDADMEKDTYIHAQEALRWVADNLGTLWD